MDRKRIWIDSASPNLLVGGDYIRSKMIERHNISVDEEKAIMEGNGARKLGWIAIALGGLALFVAISGRMQMNGARFSGPHGFYSGPQNYQAGPGAPGQFGPQGQFDPRG